jgi:hypothetical protein
LFDVQIILRIRDEHLQHVLCEQAARDVALLHYDYAMININIITSSINLSKPC